MKVGSLFAGIGGFDIAARNVGWTTAWYSEIEPYAAAVMAQNFPEVPNLGDVRQITNPPVVDILVGGFPCQGISYSGKRRKLDDARSGLWWEFYRIIEEIRPTWVVIENTSSLRTGGLGTVIGKLDAIGYVGEWHCVPACAVGAPHERDRTWIIARGSSHDEQPDEKTGANATAAAKHGALFVKRTLVSVRASLLNNGKLWPTPCASEHKFRIQGNSQQSHSLAGIARREALALDPQSIGQLNPEFLEWLMGFPIGGTALDALATQSFRTWQKSSFVPSTPSTLTLDDLL